MTDEAQDSPQPEDRVPGRNSVAGGHGPKLGYDEFGMLHENATEAGLTFDPEAPPTVRRAFVAGPSGQNVAALVWGGTHAELVLLHGGAQNAHTWDTVALAINRPLVAIDLPGHGQSDWRPGKDYLPYAIADDMAHTIEQLAPRATTIVGMSLGGLTAAATLARHPHLAKRIVMVDVTPGVDRDKASAIASFLAGPEQFDSFEAILERTVLFNPTRSESSLRRGILHNAIERPDGKWVWRYDRFMPDQIKSSATDTDGTPIADTGLNFARLWDAIESLPHPMLLVKGGASPVVGDDDVAELRRRRPDVRIEVVEGAGHSIQGDKPIELASLISEFAGLAGGSGDQP